MNELLVERITRLESRVQSLEWETASLQRSLSVARMICSGNNEFVHMYIRLNRALDDLERRRRQSDRTR